MPRISYVIVPIVFAITGCVTAPVQREFDRQITIPGASFDRVWTTLIDLFGERNWTITNMEKASGFINTDWMNAGGTNYMDCGKAGILVETSPMGRFNVVVRPDSVGNGTSVKINTSWRVTRAFGNSTPTVVECYSTGILEQEVHTALRRRLGLTTAPFEQNPYGR
jgi:uncharacterized lipoprotein